MNVQVISKATGAISNVAGDAIDLNAPSIVRLDITRAQVAGFERQGHDLVIRLVDGETIRVVDFYPDQATIPNDLVLRETDGSQWLAHIGDGSPRFSLIRDFDDLLAGEAAGGGSSLTIPAILGGLAAAGGLAAVAGGGGGSGDARPSGGGQQPDPGTGTPAPDRDPPAAPTATVRSDGAAVIGRGEPGATVSIRTAAGAVIGTVAVAADGSYTAAVSPAQLNGERLTVTQADAAGNVSPTTAVQAPDTTAPTAPTAAIDAAGATITGRGEAGATVTVRDPSGAVIGTAVVAADGTYTVTLPTPQTNGGTLTVTQADPAGNVSPATSTAAPDTTAPAAPTAAVTGDGAQVTGRGEPGATVTVRDPSGAVIGTAVVAADGTYTVTLPTPQTNGGTLTVTQADPAGNVSPATNAPAPDTTAPAAPTAAVTGGGAQVTGRGEAGATVTVRDAAGTTLATATVAADGSYAATLAPAQRNGEALTVTQADAAGNVSPPTSTVAPDVTAPAAPTIAIDATGAQVSGRGEPGARVTITDPAGATIGTALVAADGSYTATLTTPQVNGERVDVRQADASGNASGVASTIAPDLTAPAQPTAAINADGMIVSGTGEPGARITVTDAAGIVLGSTTVAADGSYGVTLVPAQANGETLGVVQADAAGNAAPPVSLIAPDITAPAAPVAAIDGTGSVVTGTGEPGARIAVRDANGAAIGTATVDERGSYAAILTPAQVNAQTLTVTQTDAAGNASPAAPLVAPDLTAPDAPTAIVGADGTTIAGSGEPGAVITVRSPLGAVIATATVAADGRYSATLSPAQTDGEALVVRQADAAGNVSPPVTATAPDLVVDTDPPAPTAIVTADGSAVTGVAIGGATITLYDANGVVIGTGVAGADGSYRVALTPPRIDGETVRVTQTEADGDVSPPATAIAPDLTAPAAPVATLDATGGIVTGTGEAGAVVTVRAADGTALGTATVAANGTYAVVLTTVQDNGGTLSVTQADAAGNVSPATSLAAPDLTAPAAPAAAVDATGTSVTGTGEPGTTVTVRDAGGTVIGTATVAANGSYTAPLAPAQANGETVSVTLTDAAGNVSAPTSAVAPDITAPAAPTLAVGGDGTSVTGTGEPGATVTITDPAGTTIGTAIVAADGRYATSIAPAQINGERLGATQADAAGNASGSTTALAPDLVAPAAPTATINGDGTIVSGTGEAGATIRIVGPGGTAIGSALVAADGRYTVTLTPAQANGEALSVTQRDAAGNPSPAVRVLAPDITAPPAPTAAITADGTIVTGRGEAGATVTVTSPAGTPIGSAIVAADGSYSVTLTPAQANGGTLSVAQADAAGNASPPVSLPAPDITAPAAPTATVSADGTIVTGRGEAGARVTITSPAGTTIGSAIVLADGSYSVTLTPPQTNGERLGASQADAAGNGSGSVVAIAPDLTAPLVPVATIDATGTTVTGTGEAGATVTVRDPGGATIGSALVGTDGTYTATLTPAQANGEALTVVQTDAAGNPSPVVPLTAPDITAPPAPPAAIDTTGTIVTGTGERGATVTVRDAGGATIGTAVVNAQGSYSVTLATPQVDNQSLTVIQTDRAGNPSPATPVTAPDLTPPAAPTALVAADGLSVSGIGEAGATVTVRDPLGVAIGTAVVAADRSYTVTLATPQIDGETLSVTQADVARNVSPATTAVAPDLVPDTAPSAPTAAVGADGATVAGMAIGGATITVYNAAGAVIATGIANADGSYSVALAPPQINGETVRVTQTEADGDISPPASAVAPDLTPPAAPTATLDATGSVVTGTGEPGATVTVRAPDGTPIGTAIVNAGGAYAATLTPAQTNGEQLSITQADAANNVSPPVSALAPDLTAPAAPTATVGADGAVVTGTGEPGATVTITGPGNAILGTALVGGTGSYAVTLTIPQRNGEALVATQSDAAGNVSPPANAVAPDLTAPPPPADLAITGDGTTLTGTGEAGARVEVRGSGGALLGATTVAANGSFTVPLSPVQVTGATVSVTQADVAGNVSGAATVIAPFDIQAFGNTDTAGIDLVPVTTTVNAGTANYLALVSLGIVNLQAQVLAIPNVQFTVAAGHTLGATFTYNALIDLGVASNYAVVVQRFDGTNWVAVSGAQGASLLQLGVAGGDLVATETLGPGTYRAFVTFEGVAGLGVLGRLDIAGQDSDFTDIAAIVPAPGSGNVITDPGPGGEVDVVSPATRVDSVTHNGVVTTLTGNGTIVTGDWGTLVINTDGSYTYTPNANAAAIGNTDVFTYTLIDPGDGERESASLSITIGSGDITGAPLAANDVAIADVTYRNVEVTTPPATAFSYSTGLFGGNGSSSFAVQANTTADVTIVARTGNLALLPTYTLVVTRADGSPVRTVSSVAVLSLGNATATFVLDDLPAGNYSYSVNSGTAALGFTSTVSLGTTTTFLNSFEVATRETVQGNLFANDTTNTPFAALHVDRGTGFAEVGDTPVVLTGRYGSLTVNEAGGYSYQASATLAYSAVDLFDTFTYQLVQPNGATSTATLTVTIDVPADGPASLAASAVSFTAALDTDVIALDGATAHVAAIAPPAEGAAVSLAAYDLFEGKGDLEDVLTRYLATQTDDRSTEVAAAGHPPMIADVIAPPVADPLDYLAISPDDHDRHGITTNHVV